MHEYIVAALKEMDFFPSSFMLRHHQTHHEDSDHHQPHTSLTPNILPPPQDFHGVASFLGNKRSSKSFPAAGVHHQQVFRQETNIGNGNGNMGNMMDDHLSDEDDDGEGSQLAGGEKKRRLNMEQVRTLEKNFELGSKLDAERKLQLARALGLKPRQVGIWFQNRRARWKIKQLEKDYQQLKAQFQALKHEHDSLQSHNHKLHAQILALKNRDREPTELINLNKETEGSACSNRSENRSGFSRRTPPAIDSPPNIIRQPSQCDVARQLFQNNSSSATPDLQCHKIDHHHHHQKVKEESFSGMFCGITDQTGFWPWLEQQFS